jgi:hypothetical protein
VALLWLAWSSVARAQAEPPRVWLSVDPCVAADAAEVRRIAAVELDARLVDRAQPDATQVVATCDAALVRIDAIDSVTGKSLSRRVNLESEIPSARARLLAIAIAELVSASWTELASNPTPRVPPAAPPPSDEAKAAAPPAVREEASAIGSTHASAAAGGRDARPERRPFRVEALAEMRAFPSPAITSLGFGAAVSWHRSGTMGIGLDVLADEGRTSTPLGTVSVDALSMGPCAFLEMVRGAFTLRGSAGVRVGVVALSGHAASSNVRSESFRSPWGGPFAAVAAYFAIGDVVALTVGGDAGDAPFPVHGRVVVGSAVSDVSIAGPWLGARVGVTASF